MKPELVEEGVFWCIGTTGEIYRMEDVNSRIDIKLKKVGNYFKTKAGAGQMGKKKAKPEWYIWTDHRANRFWVTSKTKFEREFRMWYNEDRHKIVVERGNDLAKIRARCEELNKEYSCLDDYQQRKGYENE